MGEAVSAGIFIAVALCHMLVDAMEDWSSEHESGPFITVIVGTCFSGLVTLEVCQEAVLDTDAAAQGPRVLKRRTALALCIFFALVSPVAMVVTIFVGIGENPDTVALINALATGTFLYLALDALPVLKGAAADAAHDHGHTHDIDTSSFSKALFCFIFLSAHSIIDGLVIEVQNAPAGVVVVTLAIAMHKFWAGLALGFKLAQASESGTALRHALISAEGTEAGYPAAPLDCPAHRGDGASKVPWRELGAFWVGFASLAAVSFAV